MDPLLRDLEQRIDSAIKELQPSDGDNGKFHALRLAKTRLFMCAEEAGIPTSKPSQDVVTKVVHAVSTAIQREPSKRDRLFGTRNSRNGERTEVVTAALREATSKLEGLLDDQQRSKYKERCRSHGFKQLASEETTEIKALIDTIIASRELDSEDRQDTVLEQLARVRANLLSATKYQDVRALSHRMGNSSIPCAGMGSANLEYDGTKAQALATYHEEDGSSSTVYVEVKLGKNTDSRRRLMQRLAAVLNSAPAAELMRILPCRGTLEIRSNVSFEPRFCAVYDLPSTADVASKKMPFTLHDLLVDPGFRPSLSERIKLALELATGLMHLLAVGWMHKEIRSANVMMFGDSLARRELSQPRFVGLTYARDNSEKVVSDRPDELYDVWRHPDYPIHGGDDLNFRPEYDIYSLGLVLFEIGCWKALDSLFKELRRDIGTSVTMKTIGRNVINREAQPSCRGDLEYRAGNAYAKAVEACMDPNLKDLSTEDLVSRLRDQVVLKLERCLQCMG